MLSFINQSLKNNVKRSAIRVSNSNIEKFEFNNVKLAEAMHECIMQACRPSYVHVRLVVNDVIKTYLINT